MPPVDGSKTRQDSPQAYGSCSTFFPRVLPKVIKYVEHVQRKIQSKKAENTFL
jgi:hypothetical protein